MHLQIGKKFKFYFYFFLIIFLTSINNFNFNNTNIFSIKVISVNGFSESKNNQILREIKNIKGENIFFLDRKYFNKLIHRNDTKNLNIKKIYPDKLVLTFVPANPICLILNQNERIFLGDNGKLLDIKKTKKKIPTVFGSNDIENIFKIINLLKSSKINYENIESITFFKSNRFDVNLSNKILIKFPIKFSIKTLNYASNLLNDKKFANSKIIDLRIKDRIIKYE